MRFIGLLLTLAIVGYLFYVLYGPGPKPLGGQKAAAQAAVRADSTLSAETGLPPPTRTTAAGMTIERAQQVQKIANERTRRVNGLLQGPGSAPAAP